MLAAYGLEDAAEDQGVPVEEPPDDDIDEEQARLEAEAEEERIQDVLKYCVIGRWMRSFRAMYIRSGGTFVVGVTERDVAVKVLHETEGGDWRQQVEHYTEQELEQALAVVAEEGEEDAGEGGNMEEEGKVEEEEGKEGEEKVDDEEVKVDEPGGNSSVMSSLGTEEEQKDEEQKEEVQEEKGDEEKEGEEEGKVSDAGDDWSSLGLSETSFRRRL